MNRGFIGPLFDGCVWPRVECLDHGPFPCADASAIDGVFDDPRTLLHVTPGFEPGRPFAVIAFFHGWCATLTRRIGGARYHVVETYRLIEQVDAACTNAVLIAPQFARDADTDLVDMPGHPGNLAQPGGFARWLDEAGERIAARLGTDARVFHQAPILLMSYSGGYRAAACALAVGGAGNRLIGFIGLDTIYGETDAFAAWFAAHYRHAFLAAVYTGGCQHEHASAAPTQALMRTLSAMRLAGIRVRESLPRQLVPGVASFVPVGDPSLHLDLVAAGWPRFDQPVRRLLRRVPLFTRRSGKT